MKVILKHGLIVLVNKEYVEVYADYVDVENIIDVPTAKRLRDELNDAIAASESASSPR